MRLDEIHVQLKALHLTDDQVHEVWNVLIAIINDVVERVFNDATNARRHR